MSAFHLETTTIWSFPERGQWATHYKTAQYRGNFAPQVPRNLILRYSNEGDIVLDPFVGSGTTLIECKLLNRRGIGVDINPDTITLCKRNLAGISGRYHQALVLGDARSLKFLDDACIDLIIAHPPYADAIKYSKDISGDLSLISDIERFKEEMRKVAKELWRVLKPRRYCAVLIGDLRRNTYVVPLGFEIFDVFCKVGFKPKEIIIKLQHNCKGTQRWVRIKKEFLLLAHEYLFVFEKLNHASCRHQFD